MEYPDLYQHLHRLLNQIPRGMVSTNRDLAEALGDVRASAAVAEALKRDEFHFASDKVVEGTTTGRKYFSGFVSEHPLRSLLDIQRERSSEIVVEDRFDSAELIAGVDAAYRDDEAFASCLVLDRELNVTEEASTRLRVRFPYIPGYLSFREAPAVEAVVKRLRRFDVLMVNGHGIAHPRGCGLASQVGLDLAIATIGVATRILVGTVGIAKDGWAPLHYGGRVVGAKIEEDRRAPIYVSVGNKISLKTSVDLARAMRLGGRLPEPLRLAHQASLDLRRCEWS